MPINISPNMLLPIPVIGQEASPQWAADLNNSLTLVDQHNHTPGYGVPIPAAGLNITSDLTLNNSNLINIKSLRMIPQSILVGASDLDCLFVNGVDLYYNDGVGNHVRITQSGGVAGSPGSISNLTSPASASYVAGTQTFVWQSDANTPANMDNASIILRNLVANSFGLTLNPPSAMGSNFSLTLPNLPSSQKIMTLDASGNMAGAYLVDNSSIEVNANIIRVKAGGIQQTMLAARTTGTSVGAGGIAIANSSGSFATASMTFSTITNQSVTLVTTGRPVRLALQNSGTTNGSMSIASTDLAQGQIAFARDASRINLMDMQIVVPGSNETLVLPLSSFSHLDIVAAGTYTYTVQARVTNVDTTLNANEVVLVAYEI